MADSHLPRQIRERAKRLRLHEEQLDQAETASEQPAETASEPPEASTQAPPAEPGQAAEAVQEAPTEPEPAPEPEPEPEPEPAPSDDWEHKYKTLSGKYQNEVPRLHNEIRELRSALDVLHRQMSSANQPKEPEAPPSLVTADDVDAFGEDLVDLQRRVAREVLAAETEKLRKENEAIRQQMQQVQGTSFEARLLQAVPDFQQVDQDPRWVAWLDEFDPMLQGPRRAIAQAAYSRGDVNAVRAYVDLFKRTIQPSDDGAVPTQARAQQVANRQAELQRQVQPPKAAAPATTPKSGKDRVFTRQEAEQSYNQVRQLLAKGKIDAAAALEQEISAAWMEGRVRD
ncbi:MAG: hypothetical protein VBE63_08460 [Lamprobacter sp.]|uniref:hypothetical protein n=1 Tax=Lamprobacter sp. TaxID=3100796 RepID=UPI002B25C1C9|nr:hypothetical protein [Lamprobacter sp.]MEA3639962.1 hypothetical protein [Lamprobacter sp.]